MNLSRTKKILTAAAIWLWPVLAWAQTKLDNPIGTLDPNELYARLIGGLMMVTGTLTLAVVILGGYTILTAAGNSENFQKGKKMIAYAFIGLLLTMGSYAILATTINVLTGGQGGIFNGRAVLFDPLNITKGPGEFYGQRLLGFALSALGALTLLITIYGGLLWMTAAGNEERVGKAKKTLGYGVLGLAIVLGSYSLVNFVYQPVYKIVTGEAVQPEPNTQIRPATDKTVPCFRFSTTTIKDKNGQDQVVNKNYGGVCALETEKECNQVKNGLSRGQAYYKIGATLVKNCAEIGACVQDLPGFGFKNRVLMSDCKKESFQYTGQTLPSGSCPFTNTSPGEGDKAGNCYAAVKFLPETDYPVNNAAYQGADEEWACFRKYNDGQSDCHNLTSKNCSLVVGGDYANEPGKWVRGAKCADIGYCQIILGGLKQSCRDRIAQDMCAPKLFPSVGYPNRLWGCSGFLAGGYELIDGQCYVPGPPTGMKWTASKLCPPGNN